VDIFLASPLEAAMAACGENGQQLTFNCRGNAGLNQAS
jgi:hypothetical protein